MLARIKSASIGAWMLLATFGVAAAQDAPDTSWQIESRVGLSLTQSSFNSAWAGDEVGTLSWIGTWNSSANKILAPWAHWTNTLLLQFGQTHQQDPDRDMWLAPTKSSDKITYRGKMAFPYGGWFDPFVAFDADSQFFTRLQGVETRLFTPSVLSESAGLARTFVDTDQRNVSSRLGFALKQRIDRLAFSSSTSEPETNTSVDSGFEWFSTARITDKDERAVYATELRVFKAVATSETDPARRLYWSAFDVDWQNTLSSKVTKWLSFDLFWQVLYDKQINKIGQFKQTLGVGFTWQLAS